MSHTLRRDADRRIRLALGCAALLVALAARGTPAHAQPAKPGVEQQMAQLATQLSALQHRVEELEKRTGAVVQQDATSADAARVKTLEQRLASLERALESKNAESNKAGAQTVRAPFVVVDENGKTLFRVDVAPGSNRARAAVGDPAGMHVHLGPNVEGGATVAIMNNATDGNLYLIGSAKNSYIGIKNERRVISLSANTESAIMQILNGSGNAVITLRGQNNGIFQLSNEAGETRVSAGVLPAGTGAVRAGPGSAPTGPGIPPSQIVGWKR